MKRFQKYLNKSLHKKFIEDEQVLHDLNVAVRYCPESFEYLDEIEFVLDYLPDKDIVITVAVEQLTIKRIMIGWAGPADDEETCNPFTDEELHQVLAEKEKTFVDLFNYVTIS